MEDYRLVAERRAATGTRATRRLRTAGRVPANLYGRSRNTVALTLSADDVKKVVAHGSKVVDVEVDGDVDKAVIQELQWDTFSTHVQHVDMKRVDPDGMATVDVRLVLTGEPPALKTGAQIKVHSKTIRLTCADFRIPRQIEVRVGSLQPGNSVTVADVTVPDGAKVETPGETVVVELYDPRHATE